MMSDEKVTIMDRLKPLDALFVDAEDQDKNTSMAIASIAVFEGPPPSHEEVLALVADRLPLMPRYRQKLRMVPFRLGRPVWVDDPDFDLCYHIRRTALPEPGGDQQLAELMARVMSDRLDRDHPLWEYWVIEGLVRGRWALISKVHHCMVDGISGADLYRVLLECPPEPAQPAADTATDTEAGTATDTEADEPPSAVSLIAEAASELVRLPVRDARVLSDAVANPDRAIRQATDVMRAVVRFTPSLWPAVRSSLSGNIGQQRRYTWARASLADIKMIKREFGGTVNDVVLAAISSGLRALLLSRGEQPEPHEVPSLVPVSVRAPGDEGSFGNQVSATVADLPVHVSDPVERLAVVRTELDSLKESNEAVIGESLVALGHYSLYPLTSWLVRLAFWLPQREIVTVTTNVPGPGQPLYWMGRRLEEIIPYVPIASTVRTGISIFSYAGNVVFGITGDYAANPDLDVLARGIEHGVSELLLAAEQHAAAASVSPSRPARKAPATRKSPAKAPAKSPAKAPAKSRAKAPAKSRSGKDSAKGDQ
jgi:diacylglycerol O-acyltransferase / wax synthase